MDKRTEVFSIRISPTIKRELKMIPEELEKRMNKEIELILAKTCFMHNHFDKKLYGIDEE